MFGTFLCTVIALPDEILTLNSPVYAHGRMSILILFLRAAHNLSHILFKCEIIKNGWMDGWNACLWEIPAAVFCGTVELKTGKTHFEPRLNLQ